ncbi:AraC family transcriptional regulator [Proteinivorax tanatarense]|uniref:AraC family transcriptional regulator n=1 Tax=Proteinivorax tanatarense TaxID=1260629 RepID=A0AAU7VIU9_9FIRM
MVLKDLVDKLNLIEVNVCDSSSEVKGGLCTDLLSLVFSHSSPGSIWVTHQNHPNIIAVALLAELSAIIVVGEVEEETIKAAKEKGMNVFSTQKSLFDIVGKLYSLGVSTENASV